MLSEIQARLWHSSCHGAVQKGGSMKIRSLSLLGVIVLALSIPSFSQAFRGGITGTLTDPSGAAISGAAVKALNAETGLRRGAVTTSSGEFTFQDLPLGTYEVTATQSGFRELKVDNFFVQLSKLPNLRP